MFGVIVCRVVCFHVREVLIVRSVYVFFFFKQKTAYELRISDWSSDVCSADLDGCWATGTPTGRRPLVTCITIASGNAFPPLAESWRACPEASASSVAVS